jgi:hypothetical protein
MLPQEAASGIFCLAKACFILTEQGKKIPEAAERTHWLLK